MGNEQSQSDAKAHPVDTLVKCDLMSGKRLLEAFNNQGDSIAEYVTLEEHIDIAIGMAMKLAAADQVLACANAVKSCEKVGVNRVRKDEAMGACFGARLYT